MSTLVGRKGFHNPSGVKLHVGPFGRNHVARVLSPRTPSTLSSTSSRMSVPLEDELILPELKDLVSPADQYSSALVNSDSLRGSYSLSELFPVDDGLQVEGSPSKPTSPTSISQHFRSLSSSRFGDIAVGSLASTEALPSLSLAGPQEENLLRPAASSLPPPESKYNLGYLAQAGLPEFEAASGEQLDVHLATMSRLLELFLRSFSRHRYLADRVSYTGQAGRKRARAGAGTGSQHHVSLVLIACAGFNSASSAPCTMSLCTRPACASI